MKRFWLIFLICCFAVICVRLQAQTLGVSPVNWLPVGDTPTQPCSATSFNGVIGISSSLNFYQCSKITGSYAWNVIGGNAAFLPKTGGTLTGQLNGTSAAFSGTVAAGTALSSPNVNHVYSAENFSGADCGAKINTALSSSIGLNNGPGTVQISQGCGTSWTTAITLSAGQLLEFVQSGVPSSTGGTYTLAAPITMNTSSSIVGIPSGTFRSAVLLQEASGANLPYLIHMTPGSYQSLQDIALDCNKSANLTGGHCVYVDSATRTVFDHVSVINAVLDDIHVDGISAASCCGRIMNNSFIGMAGNNDVSITSSADWFIGSGSELEQAGSWALDGVNASAIRMVHGDIGSNGTAGYTGTGVTYGTPVLSGGGISSVPVTVGGSGYSSADPPMVNFYGGGGFGAVGIAVVNGGGSVTGVTMLSNGQQYTVAADIFVESLQGGIHKIGTQPVSPQYGFGGGWIICCNQFDNNLGTDLYSESPDTGATFINGFDNITGNNFRGLGTGVLTNTWDSIHLLNSGNESISGNTIGGGGSTKFRYHYYSSSTNGSPMPSVVDSNFVNSSGAATADYYTLIDDDVTDGNGSGVHRNFAKEFDWGCVTAQGAAPSSYCAWLTNGGFTVAVPITLSGATSISGGLTALAAVNTFGTGPSAVVGVGPNITTGAASSTTGRLFAVGSGTLTRSADTGTIAESATSSFGQPTLAAGAATTYTIADTLDILGPPTAGTNATITTPYSLRVATGNSFFGGTINTTGIISGGTKFTTSGCSVASTTGGGSAGKMTIGANACSVIITMNGVTGLTAPNGWSCKANDETAVAANATLYFSANNQTTATLSVPSTAGTTDVIDFACTAF